MSTSPPPENRAIPSDVDRALESLTRRIVALRIETPMLFFLEAHLPLTTLFHTAGLLFEPLAAPLFGAERIHTLRLLFSERKYVEELIRRLDTYSVAKAG